MDVLVFATSVRQRRQVSRVQNLLTKIPAIAQWNFDLEDCDNILRVEAKDLSPRYIESLLQNAGIYCQELDY
ncbi:hypothetical protein ACRQ5D_19280 [Mucilaginibacter sp. P25]|uniref:Uncharacterized protein n=2 Tax=Mucilaginibacter TaxID=423349 RepID=A0AAE6JFL2_9SPHI|nr:MULTISPECIES: hypothetical protein [Mucilaginibacter]QEM04645.1 hypothetical protein DIU31_014395 [Mucilaginibacter rubeus]QEM17238.1 hypothetical protein DIU38_014540 [Mucilaginibacter gossypii]QTE37765.1 hypothetical protein J3L18_01470 [Mucilaginibacter gossypii]QTE46255.1 hypothetical protein J3L19_13160 [Mucilaginibacter rubeus]QTE52852.1 hypothetical protein J3L21_13135 [Mucilaginibacter rubeus]